MITRTRPRLRGWQLGFTAPLFFVLLATTILPVLYSLALALGGSDDDLAPRTPLSLDNVETVFSGGAVWDSLALVVVFLAGAMVGELALGVFTALVLDRYLPNRHGLRVLLLWPAVLPPIAVALVFRFILQGEIGLISYYLGQVGIDQEWLTQPVSAMAVIIAIDMWQFTPFVILLTLAALKTVPDDVLEASQLDGAGAVRTAWTVVLPIIKPALISIALLRFIDAVQVFPTIYVLTRGGPGSSTQLLTFYNFEVFFGQLNFGQGAAIAVFVVLFTIGCVALFMQFQRRAERV
ncbi:carbohydrate ABC transporter permease [Haloactinopolyspora alba]|nr:sugar ABC transporter permease [Haloactinopolyspora alba]